MTSIDRRTAIQGAVAAAVATPVLAACGNNKAPAAVSRTAGTKTGDVLVKKSDVPVGGGVIFSDPQMVVTQPEKGQFKGFSSICTHQQCPVTKIADGTIDCTCHFSKYSVADGSVVSGPAPKPLPEIKINTTGDSITLG